MEKLPKLKNLRLNGWLSGLAKNLSWLFFAAFLLLLVLEAFEVNHSVQIILSANHNPPETVQQQGVRIDFTDYNSILQRIEQAPNFTPTASSSMPNPFGTGH
jgi:hypothetical protein